MSRRVCWKVSFQGRAAKVNAGDKDGSYEGDVGFVRD
jgi:hypothetical protein